MAFNGPFLGKGEAADGDAEAPKGLEVGPGDREEPGFFPDNTARGFPGSGVAWIRGFSGGGASTGGVAFECRWEGRSMFPRAFFRVLLY